MTKRDEMLAVIRDRDNQIVHHIAAAHRSWLWSRQRWHAREAKRLLALNERDLDRLPPERYHKPRPSVINAARAEQLMYARRNAVQQPQWPL